MNRPIRHENQSDQTYNMGMRLFPMNRLETTATRQEKNTWFALNSVLGKNEYYAEESRVSQLVKQRLSVVAPDITAKTIVLHTHDPFQTFALPGYIVISDSLLSLMAVDKSADGNFSHIDQGQLDAVLAHEAKHIRANDAASRGDRIGVDLLGRIRSNEITADFIGLFETLDRQNLNPHGVIRLLGTIENYEEEQEKKKKKNKFSVTSPTHGSTIDRRLNLEDMLSLVDVRNLSENVEEVSLQPSDLKAYIHDETLWQSYESLSFLEKRSFLERQFTNIINSKNSMVTSQTVSRYKQLIDWQRELLVDEIRREQPHLESEVITQQAENMMRMIAYCGFGSFFEENYISNGENGLVSWAKQFTSKEAVSNFFTLFNSPLFEQLGIHPQSDRAYIREVGKIVLYSYFHLQDTVDIAGSLAFCNDLNAMKLDGELMYEPLIEVLIERNQFSENSAKILGQELSIFPLGFDGVPDFINKRLLVDKKNMITSTNKQRQEAADSEHAEIRAGRYSGSSSQIADVFYDIFTAIRFDELNRCTDPIEYFHLIATKGVPRDLAEDNRNIVSFAQIEERMIDNYSVKKIITALQDWSAKSGIKNIQKDKDLSWAISELYSLDHLTTKQKGQQLIDRKFSFNDTKNWLTLLAIIGGKAKVLSEIANDYDDRFDPGEEGGIRKNSGTKLLNAIPSGTKGMIEFIEAIIQAPENARSLGFAVAGNIEKKDLKNLTIILQEARKRFLEKAVREKDPQLITELIQRLPIFGLEGDPDSQKLWEKAVDMTLTTIATHHKIEKRSLESLQLSQLTDEELHQVFALGCASQNTQIILRVAKEALRELVTRPTTTFTDAMDLVFNQYDHLPKQVVTFALQELIEKKARTFEEFEQLESAVRKQVNAFLEETQTIGAVALIDAIVDPSRRFRGSRSIEPIQLLEALINTGVNDKQIKQYLSQRWLEFYRTWFKPEDNEYKIFNFTSALFTYAYPQKVQMLERWVRELPERYTPLTEIVESIYRLDPAVRYGLLRKILVGDDSILGTQEGRKHLMEIFLSDHMDFSKSIDQGKGLETLLSSLLATTSQEDLYLQLNPLLLHLILQMPQQEYPYGALVEDETNRTLGPMLPQEGVRRGAAERLTAEQVAFLQHGRFIQRKLMGLMQGTHDQTVQKRSRAETQLLGILPPEKMRLGTGRFSQWELFLTLAESGDAFWAKLAQNAPLYFTPPQELVGRIMDMHDMRQGQSRLQAYRTLKREAAQQTPEGKRLREYLQKVKEIRPRIGGGSLVTVYEMLLMDGSREALTILNPNVEYHLGRVVRIATQSLEQSEQTDPSNKAFPLLRVLLKDVEQIIRREIMSPNFSENDKNLVQAMQTFNSESGSRYNMLVPRIEEEPFNKWIPGRDNIVDGVNLGRLEIIEDSGQTNIMQGKITRSDMKEATATLAKSYVYQLLVTGLAHADTHAYNFRITADNKAIAIFDRRDMIPLTAEDKGFIKQLITSMSAGQNGLLGAIVGYLKRLPENAEHPLSSEKLIQELAALPQTTEEGDPLTSKISQTILELHKRGVHVPVHIEQIGRNLQLLNQMAKKAGFGGLLEVVAPYIFQLYSTGKL